MADSKDDRLWNEMLQELRELGGTAENVRLADGPLGRGLFPIDASKPIKVHIPEPLLLEMKYARIENGMFHILPEAPVGPRERAFLEMYERDFSWGVGHQHSKALLEMVQHAPDELRNFLNSPLNAGAWLAGPGMQAVAERFFSSRLYGKYKGKAVIMPIVELANHGRRTEYEDEEGLGLSGQFQGEILVEYRDGDPLDFFQTWGFAGAGEPFARSLAMRVKTAAGPLLIRRDPLPTEEDKDPFAPVVAVEDEQLTFSALLLGHKEAPALPRSLFYRAMSNAGHGGAAAAEAFEMIHHVNRLQFYKLDEMSESAAPLLGAILRDLARYQLEAMSNCVGSRPM